MITKNKIENVIKAIPQPTSYNFNLDTKKAAKIIHKYFSKRTHHSTKLYSIMNALRELCEKDQSQCVDWQSFSEEISTRITEEVPINLIEELKILDKQINSIYPLSLEGLKASMFSIEKEFKFDTLWYDEAGDHVNVNSIKSVEEIKNIIEITKDWIDGCPIGE